MISVVIPVLNAQQTLGKVLGGLTRAAIDGLVREVVVVDAGCSDLTLKIAEDAGAAIVAASGDRGAQLAAGAAAARPGWIMTLRQDIQLLPGWEAVVAEQIEAEPNQAAWFAASSRPRLWPLGRAADGDGLLIPRTDYERFGGFASARAEAGLARRLGRVRRLRLPVLSLAGRGGPGAR